MTVAEAIHFLSQCDPSELLAFGPASPTSQVTVINGLSRKLHASPSASPNQLIIQSEDEPHNAEGFALVVFVP